MQILRTRPLRIHTLRSIAFLLHSLTTFSANGEAYSPALSNIEKQKPAPASNEDYSGVVVDQTISQFGHAFYQFFVSYWRNDQMHDRYTIAIKERVSARHGSQIFIEYKQRIVFQQFLPPANAGVRALSVTAASQVLENIVNADVQRLLMHEQDIAVDEI